MSCLVCNFETNEVYIIPNDKTRILDAELAVNMADGVFYVMRIDGICTSDYDWCVTTIEQYYNVFNAYISQFNGSMQKIDIDTTTIVLGDCSTKLDYTVQRTKHFISADLCTFYLYKITPNV